MIERYFSDIKYTKITTHDYSGNIEFVNEIVSGEFYYELPVLLFLEDKSIDNVINVVSSFGCSSCSDFESVYVVTDEPGEFEQDFSISDVSMILKYIAGWDVQIDLKSCDMNQDNRINLTDVSIMLKRIAGWDI